MSFFGSYCFTPFPSLELTEDKMQLKFRNLWWKVEEVYIAFESECLEQVCDFGVCIIDPLCMNHGMNHRMAWQECQQSRKH